jgi:hypothetical protein
MVFSPITMTEEVATKYLLIWTTSLCGPLDLNNYRLIIHPSKTTLLTIGKLRKYPQDPLCTYLTMPKKY